MSSTRNLASAKENIKAAINKIEAAKASFSINSFRESTALLFSIANNLTADRDLLETSEDQEGKDLAAKMCDLVQSSLDIIQNTRNTHDQRSDVKEELIKLAQTNNPVALRKFALEYDRALVQQHGHTVLSEALRNAAAYGAEQNIALLIDLGANSLHAGSKSGKLAIHQAVQNLQPACVKRLLENLNTHGHYFRDIDQILTKVKGKGKDKGKTTFELLKEREFTRLTKQLQQQYLEVLNLLAEHLLNPKQSQYLDDTTRAEGLTLHAEILKHKAACLAQPMTSNDGSSSSTDEKQKEAKPSSSAFFSSAPTVQIPQASEIKSTPTFTKGTS